MRSVVAETLLPRHSLLCVQFLPSLRPQLTAFNVLLPFSLSTPSETIAAASSSTLIDIVGPNKKLGIEVFLASRPPRWTMEPRSLALSLESPDAVLYFSLTSISMKYCPRVGGLVNCWVRMSHGYWDNQLYWRYLIFELRASLRIHIFLPMSRPANFSLKHTNRELLDCTFGFGTMDLAKASAAA